MRFQSYICGLNHWRLDPDLAPILRHYWDDFEAHQAELAAFGRLAGGRAYELADTIDRQTTPTLVMHDLDGKRVDRARLDPAHAELLQELTVINRPPYQGGSWLHHFAYGYLLADPGLYCTLIVTNQTAYALYKYAPDLGEWVEPLLSGQAWGATWMTETQGGSDLGANQTVARQQGDHWRLDGDLKYFASNAGIADAALVTARPEGAPPGPKGLALFLVPRLNREGELNYTVRRFKAKSATRAVPTGEVEFDDAQAYLVGRAEEGIYYTLETLTVSRLGNAVGAMGLARKAHLEALFRVRARRAFGKAIVDHPLVRHDLTDLAVRVAGGTALLFHAVQAFDRAWHDRPPYTAQYHLARFLSHLVKNRTAEHAAAATLLAMELFGGLGFMDEYAIARLHREALVTPIWEGTSNIQALDMLEAMAKKGAHEPFLEGIHALTAGRREPEAKLARQMVEKTLAELSTSEPVAAQWISKDALRRLADATCVAVLLAVAESGGERYAKMAALYAARFLEGQSYPAWAHTFEALWALPEDAEGVEAPT